MEIVNASERGGNAKEKIMNSLLDAVWDEIPIKIDEIITEDELFQWKVEWYADQEYRWDEYPGGQYELVKDIHKVAVILPTGNIVYGDGGIERPM